MRQPAIWANAAAYEQYVGRWSRLVASEFLDWLAVPPGSRWLDVGCGTGALTTAILHHSRPAEVTGVDPSEDFVAYARGHVQDERASFKVGDATALPFGDTTFDVVVSGLVLNHIPVHAVALAEMARVARDGGTVAAYVWDYAGEMQMMRTFWDSAIALDPAMSDMDQGRRYPICRPESLTELFQSAGLEGVQVRAIDVPTHFRDFDDYWSPFLAGQGPAPSYAASLTEDRRTALREHLKSKLPITPDGSIPMIARAWAIRATK